MTAPTLIVVSGPPGSGKTSLAHLLARRLGCPAICRDELKQGMVLATPGHRPSADDPLDRRTLDAFFRTLAVLLGAGVTVVAEAAYQDRLWRPGLERLTGLAALRIVRCVTDPAVARRRIAERAGRDPHRAAHADGELLRALADGGQPPFTDISLPAPTVTVDTTDGYRPSVDEVLSLLDRTADGAQMLTEGE